MELWTDLTHCWVALGDFNVVLGSHEKMGRAPMVYLYKDFRDFIDSSNLLQIPLQGA